MFFLPYEAYGWDEFHNTMCGPLCQAICSEPLRSQMPPCVNDMHIELYCEEITFCG